jgi:aminomethyltransferase
MPVQYKGVLEEARAVREAVGVFDISHMGRFRIRGEKASDHLQYCTTNDINALDDGCAQYTLFLADDGGILDDLIVYRVNRTEFIAVVNASNAERDRDVLANGLPPSTELDDETSATAMLAVQGPAAVGLLCKLAGSDLEGTRRFSFAVGRISGSSATFCRTGYTGEDGFELIVDAENAPSVWNTIAEAGAVPCGLGARDTLRVEAGFPLYGHEIHERTTPVEAGLMWAVKLDKGEFRGRAAVAEAKRLGAASRLMGIVMADRAMPRQGYEVYDGSQRIGEVTSGAFSVVRGTALGMAYLNRAHAQVGKQVSVKIRESLHAATVVRKNELLARGR